MEPTDTDLIERFLARTSGETQFAAAQRSGIGQSTISRWRKGERRALQTGMRERLVEFLLDAEREATSRPPSPDLYQHLSPADQILFILDHPNGSEALFGGTVSAHDRRKAAVAIGMDMGLPPDEIGKLAAWHPKTPDTATVNNEETARADH